ncbi:zinc-binding protein A33-like [Rhinoraja longicauda]
MASKHQIQSLTEDATCPICLDFFTDPVILECGHNFCRSCITQSWDREGRNSCPECREEFADRALKVNRALASMTEKARALSLNTGGKESKLHCEKHQEELKLFCETDKKLVCLICRDAREHKSHSFMPIQEAVESYKELIKTSLEILTKNKSAVEEMEQQQKEKISGVREQSQNLLTYITSVFAELRQILNEKERLFLRDLREDEESVLNPMENNLRAIQEEINSIQEKLTKLQERMNQTDSLIFLKEETRQKRRISDDEHMLSVADGALAVGKYDHPFLLNTVFSEVPDGIKRVSVTLDVETANPWLEVSEDRKWVRWTPGPGGVSLTPGRGLQTGRVCWDRRDSHRGDITGRWRWRGVGAGVWESPQSPVERKGRDTLSPETGVWRIRRWGNRFDAVTSSPSPLPARPIPGRVGVYTQLRVWDSFILRRGTPSPISTPSLGINSRRNFILSSGPGDEDQWLRICSGAARVCKRVGSRDRVRSGAQGLIWL